MQISTRAGSGAELRVEPGNEYFSKKAVRLRDSGDTGKSQLFDQPILQGTEEPLDPTLACGEKEWMTSMSSWRIERSNWVSACGSSANVLALILYVEWRSR